MEKKKGKEQRIFLKGEKNRKGNDDRIQIPTNKNQEIKTRSFVLNFDCNKEGLQSSELCWSESNPKEKSNHNLQISLGLKANLK